MCQGWKPQLGHSPTSQCLSGTGSQLPRSWLHGTSGSTQPPTPTPTQLLLPPSTPGVWVWALGVLGWCEQKHTSNGCGGGHLLPRLATPQHTEQRTSRYWVQPRAAVAITWASHVHGWLRRPSQGNGRLISQEVYRWQERVSGSQWGPAQVPGTCEGLHSFNKYSCAQGTVTLSSKKKTLWQVERDCQRTGKVVYFSTFSGTFFLLLKKGPTFSSGPGSCRLCDHMNACVLSKFACGSPGLHCGGNQRWGLRGGDEV